MPSKMARLNKMAKRNKNKQATEENTEYNTETHLPHTN